MLNDPIYAGRALRKSPGFTVVALLTLAIGIGLNAVLFSIVNTVLLRPLPFAAADGLVSLTASDPPRGIVGLNLSYTRLTLLHDSSTSFDALGAYVPSTASVATGAGPEQVPSAIATRSLLETLGVGMAAGRGFLAAEDAPGGADVAILSYAFWQSHYGGRAAIVGQPLSMNGRSVVVVGVLPASFRFPFLQPEPQIWVPRVFENPLFTRDRVQSGASFLSVIGRLRPGETLAHAQAELDTLGRRYAAAFPGNADAGRYQVQAAPLHDALVAPVRLPLEVLMAGAGFVLLTGCVNLASLLLARASSRQKGIAVRYALGASRARLLRQLFAESLLLTAAGAAMALLLAAGTPGLLSLLPAGTLPRLNEVTLDGRVFWFSAAISVMTAILVSVAPARATSAAKVQRALVETGRGATSRRAARVRALLVVVETAVALVLVCSAGLLLESLAKLTSVNPGFDARNAVTFSLTLPRARYPGPPQQTEFFRQAVDALQAVPQVESAAATNFLPIVGGTRFIYVCPEGATCQGIGKDPLAAVRHVTPGYFATMRIPVVRGRAFDPHDDARSQHVCIINEKAAADFFPGQEAVGKRILDSRNNITAVVVGVARNVRALGLGGQLLDEFYAPAAQAAIPVPTMSVVLRSTAPVQPLVEAARRVVGQLDPDVPLATVQTMAGAVSDSVAEPWLTSRLTGAFAVVALGLAAVGVFGLMSYTVAERRREMAIRIAVGATPSDIRRLMAVSGGRVLAAGIVVGIPGVLASTRALRAILFNVSPLDPAILGGVTAMLVVVLAAACYLPTRRALGADAVASLRGE